MAARPVYRLALPMVPVAMASASVVHSCDLAGNLCGSVLASALYLGGEQEDCSKHQVDRASAA